MYDSDRFTNTDLEEVTGSKDNTRIVGNSPGDTEQTEKKNIDYIMTRARMLSGWAHGDIPMDNSNFANSGYKETYQTQ